MVSDELLNLEPALSSATELVEAAAEGSMTFSEFVDAYDNFYWRAALDGHESGPEGLEVLARFAEEIELHRHVAEDVLARVFRSGGINDRAYREAGRIDEEEAVSELRKLVEQFRS